MQTDTRRNTTEPKQIRVFVKNEETEVREMYRDVFE